MDLTQLFASLFSTVELRDLLRKGPSGPELVTILPEGAVAPLVMAGAAAEALERRGLVNLELIIRLLEARPGRADLIRAFAEAHGVSLVATSGMTVEVPARALPAADAPERGDDPDAARLFYSPKHVNPPAVPPQQAKPEQKTFAAPEVIEAQRESPRHLVLRVTSGAEFLRYISLIEGSTIYIGRAETADLRLLDATVSKVHARVVTFTQECHFFDLGSTNGSSVNGKPTRYSPVRPGDTLCVGTVTLRCEALTIDEFTHLKRVHERLASTHNDALTGLLTPPAWTDELARIAGSDRRRDRTTSVVVIAVEGFDELAAMVSRATIDNLLRVLARLLMLELSDRDVCGRLGDDSFAIVLAGTNLAGARAAARAIQGAIRRHFWGRISDGLEVDVRIGMAELKPSETTDACHRRAIAAAEVASRVAERIATLD